MNAAFDLFGNPKTQTTNLDQQPDLLDSDPRSSIRTEQSLSTVTQKPWWRWVFIGMTAVVVLVVGRLVQLQTVEGATLRGRAEYNRLRIQYLAAPRGSILDRNGQTLATNVPNFALTVVPSDVPSTDEAYQAWLKKLQQLMQWDDAKLADVKSKIKAGGTDPVVMHDHLGYDQALPLMVQTAELPGVAIQSLPTRQYPLGPAASSVLGYTGIVNQTDLDSRQNLHPQDRVGKAGLELTYDTTLFGTPGRREIERDVRNQRMEVLHEQNPKPGQSLQLSIDAGLQQVMYDSLAQAVKQAHGTGGAAVAINPQTGAVLGMTSYPSYDDNWFVNGSSNDQISQVLQDPANPLLDRAIAGEYPSGSIIKPLIASAALAEKIVTPNTTVLSTGGITIGHDTFPDWKAGGHGITNLSKAIADSVNTYFYTVGGGYKDQPGLGVDRIVSYLEKFNWGSPLQIDLPGERGGFLPTKQWREQQRPSPWRLGDTYHLSIGQGDLSITPLQAVMGIATVANGGTVYQPHVVQAVLNPDGSVAKTIAPNVLEKVNISQQDFAAVRAGLRQGVTDGSSRALQSLPVTSGAKTGTAQFGNQGKTHAWHVAFAPFDDPQIAIAVIIEAGGEGNVTALPVTKAALNWYFKPTP